MAIIVEDGTTVSNSNSYVTELELTEYATARGITIAGSTEQILIKAMDYLETLYFIGMRKSYEQTLQWPRYDVVIDGFALDSTVIPNDLKIAQILTALKIDSGEIILADTEQEVLKEKVGDLEVEYQEGSNSIKSYREINAKLSKLLSSSKTGVFFKVGRA